MKKASLSLIFLLIAALLYPQDFFHGDFDRSKSYVILMNPTAGNLEVVDFLVKNGLLNVDQSAIDFVGVYHTSQEYDFSKSLEYIKTNQMEGYYLHGVSGELSEENLFRENGCTDDFRVIFENSVGVFFFGGADIPPSVYGEKNLYSSTTDPGRHYFEVSFQFHLLGGSSNPSFTPLLEEDPGYMVTGFCLGMQTMNVATGGSLYQDIPAQIYDSHDAESNLKIGRSNLHRNYWQNISDEKGLMGFNLHRIQFTENQFFGKTVKLSRKLNPLIFSSHHQSVKDVGAGLEVTALSPDGKVIEGLVHKKYPHVFSVQFHPEVPNLYEEMNDVKLKFSPDDTLETIHNMLDRKSLKFHRQYWAHISSVIEAQSK